MAELILVLGGTRSGKSAVAERLLRDAEAAGRACGVVYVATARVDGRDPELRERIAAHRARRPSHWTTVEVSDGQDPAAAVAAAPPGAGVLVDGLGLWVAGRMETLGLLAADGAATPRADGRSRADDRRADAAAVVAEGAALAAAAAGHAGGPVVVVAEEVGLGVVPADAATRRFVDLHGAVVQALSATADRAFLVTAGRAIPLPRPGPVTAAGEGRDTDPADRGEPAGPEAIHPVDNRSTPAPTPHTGQRGTQTPPRRAHERPHTLRALPEAAPGPAHARAAPRPYPPGASDGCDQSTSLRVHGDTMVPDEALDLAVNVDGTRPPDHVREALLEAVEHGAAYPDPAVATVALARRHGRDPGSVLVTAGAAEAFWLLAAAIRARFAVVVQPQFTEPEAALRAHGIPVRQVVRQPEAGWMLDPDAVGDDADLVVVGNPNNPTGVLDPAGRVAALCRPGRLTVVDEAFMDFVPDETASLAHRGDLPGLVVVRSVTKLWGLAGVRAGYLLGPPGVVARLRALRQPWSVSTPALAALTVCADDDAYRRQVAIRVADDRAELVGALRGLPGVTVWDAAANFVLLRVPDGPSVHAALLEDGIATRTSTFPGLDTDHLRITVRGRDATRRLVAALAGILPTDRQEYR